MGHRASRNRLQTEPLLRANHREQVRRRLWRCPAGRGEGTGQGACVLVPRRVRSMGSEESATRAVESVQRPRYRPGEHMRVFPISNWTEMDIWQYIEREGIELPSIYFSHQRKVFERDGMLMAVSPYIEQYDHEEAFEANRPFSNRRRHVMHRGVRVTASRRSRGYIAEVSATQDYRTWRQPGRRPHRRGGDGRPQAGGLLLMSMELVRLATTGSVDDGKSTLIGRMLYDTKQIFQDQTRSDRAGQQEPGQRLRRPGTADRRPQGRAGAGHHHRRCLPLLRYPEAKVRAG